MFKIHIDGQEIPKNTNTKTSSKTKFSTNIDTQMLEQFRLLLNYKKIHLNVAIEVFINYLVDEDFLKQFLNDCKLHQKEYYNKRNTDLKLLFEKYKQDNNK